MKWSNMSDRQARRWERLRQHGWLRYVAVHGVVYWGIATAVLAAAFGVLLGVERPFIEQVGINLIFFPIGGIFFGLTIWASAEWQYGRWKEAVARRQPLSDRERE